MVAGPARPPPARGYDIVHVHEPMLPPGLAAMAAAQAGVVATFHMASADARWARRRIDAAIAVSPQARDLVSSVLPGRYRIVPNAVETHAPITPGANGNGVPRLLYIGRADPPKGLDVLLRAFRRVSAPVHLDLNGLKWTFLVMLIPLAGGAAILWRARRTYPGDAAAAGARSAELSRRGAARRGVSRPGPRPSGTG